MSKDSTYRDVAYDNRGDAIEEMAFKMLKEVFGDQNTYRGVRVMRGKDVVTDIDVLAVAGNKAVIVQAKAKRLTELSKRGDIESVKLDFSKAIQSAYDQALKSRKAVIEERNLLRDSGGQTVELHEDLDDAYIICLTGDHYPAIATQLHAFLGKRSVDPYPLAMSVFDLDILTFYLTDPFDFLYYLRQRSSFAEHFFADCEMALLGFHLKSKLYPFEHADIAWIDSSSAELIDSNFPIAKGFRPGTEVAKKPFHYWRNKDFNQIVQALKNSGIPGFTDAIFFLFDLAGAGADNIIEHIHEKMQATLFDGDVHSISMPSLGSGRGLSFVSYPDSFESIQEQFLYFAQSTKYKHRADDWLVLGSVAGSTEFVDMFFYSREKWQYDSELEKAANVALKHGTMVRGNRQKIGRNDPCFCESGLKYKKCHGR